MDSSSKVSRLPMMVVELDDCTKSNGFKVVQSSHRYTVVILYVISLTSKIDLLPSLSGAQVLQEDSELRTTARTSEPQPHNAPTPNVMTNSTQRLSPENGTMSRNRKSSGFRMSSPQPAMLKLREVWFLRKVAFPAARPGELRVMDAARFDARRFSSGPGS